MTLWNLPPETIEFLQSGRQFDYDPSKCEPQEVRLKSFDQLTEDFVWIYPEAPGDPHAGEEGYYRIPAVSLTGHCDLYDPEFILLWLPNEKLFGTWDSDHAVLSIFPDAKWSDIVARPAEYLNAQWDADSAVSRPAVPSRGHEFVLGQPF